jgi:hypothetical protein
VIQYRKVKSWRKAAPGCFNVEENRCCLGFFPAEEENTRRKGKEKYVLELFIYMKAKFNHDSSRQEDKKKRNRLENRSTPASAAAKEIGLADQGHRSNTTLYDRTCFGKEGIKKKEEAAGT